MKQLFIILMLAVVGLTAPSLIVAQESKVEAELRTLLDEVRSANVKSDVAALDKHMAADCVRIRGNGLVATKAEVLDWFKTGNLKMSVDDASDVKIHIFGNTAVVTNTEDVKGVMMGKEYGGQYRDSRVFVKQGSEWKEVLHQSTKIAP